MLLVPTVGPLEIGIIALVVILLFGVGKLGGLGKDLGSSIKEFRHALKDDESTSQPTEAQQHEAMQATQNVQPARVQPTKPQPPQSGPDSKGPGVF